MSRVHNMRPDAPDLRDRLYSPTLKSLPRSYNSSPYDSPRWRAAIRDQKQTSACTGFALAATIEALLPAPAELSPFMLYYMARRYDEIPGDTDSGSTARAAMKAWHKHGACLHSLWPKIELNPCTAEPGWKSDGFHRPLGAYYRVDHSSIADMHAALNETGVIYATAQIHTSWQNPDANGRIQVTERPDILGGHAFALVGYDENGFWLQNSWGADWGKCGFAHLSYRDWNLHSMDSWVAQLGVNISRYRNDLELGLNFARVNITENDPLERARPLLSSNENLSAQQINPFIINLENNGRLSDRGQFHTRAQDLQELVTTYLPQATQEFGLDATEPIDVAIYAHGGLTDEKAAANTARLWIPALYAQKVFPIFMMWETGVVDTLQDITEDTFRSAAAVPFWGAALDMWNDRMESLLSLPGTLAWDEMKENARLATSGGNGSRQGNIGGLQVLHQALMAPELDAIRPRIRLHLIGHSAGAIFLAHLLNALMTETEPTRQLRVEGIYFMAPAIRVDLFEELILQHYTTGSISAFTQFHLPNSLEREDNCLPLPYRRSLLYLVSNAFERGQRVPILGMEKFKSMIPSTPPHPNVQVWDLIESHSSEQPLRRSTASKHGGFSADGPTVASIIQRIVARR